MYLLKKVIQLREHAHPDHEKPFLEHLDDLRTMIMRIVIALVIATIACFIFQKHLMEVLRRPIQQMLIAKTAESLPSDRRTVPRPATVAMWEKAKRVELAAAGLAPEQRAAFFDSLGEPDLVFHARSIVLFKAALLLPEDRREPFLARASGDPELHRQTTALLVKRPDPQGGVYDGGKMMSSLKPTETFMLSMKLSFFAGIVVSFPFLLLFILQFILPGLHHHEKRVLWPAMAVGFGLFLAGVAFAYFLILPRALLFFYDWSNGMGVSNEWRIGEYISFATQFTLLFGLSFELPVVVMVLVKLGLLGYQTMIKTRAYATVAIFIAAAVLTPTPDIPTTLMMVAPMILLYEICIWLAYFDHRKALRAEEEDARQRMERLLTDPDNAEPIPQDPPFPPDPENHEEAGDDGWDGEFPQQDPHAGMDSAPLPDDSEFPQQDPHADPDAAPRLPEDGERRRMDPD